MRRLRMRAPLTGLVLALCGTVASAQDSVQRWQVFARQQHLSELIDACSAVMGIPIEYNPTEVTGSVSLRVDESMSAQEIWALANQALATKGLTSVQPPESWVLSVVPIATAPSLARLERGSIDDARAGFVKVAFSLERAKPDAVVEVVKLVLSKSGAVTAVRDSSTLLLTDLLPHVRQALELVRRIDAAPEPLIVEEVRLDKTSPVVLAALIERIVSARKAVFGEALRGSLLASPDSRSVLLVAPRSDIAAWRDLIGRFDRVEPAVTQTYAPRRFGLDETAALIEQAVHGAKGLDAPGPWRIVRDELTGSLIVTASPAEQAEIQALLLRLESTELGSRRALRSFAIKNRGVKEVATLLEGLIQKGILDRTQAQPAEGAPGSSTTPAQGPTGPFSTDSPPRVSSGKDDAGDVTITADEATNRLIAYGEGHALDQIARLIDSLDVRSSQVLVETIVVSLTDNQTISLGVELQRLGTSGSALWRLSSLFGLGSPDPSGTALPAPGGNGFGGVVLDPGDYSAIVRALETLNEGRTLTIPKVLVNNNQEATLGSLLQTPYVSTNASTTVATTSFGGSLDAGTSITVKPQIAEGDLLVLDYTVSISSFVGAAADPALPPPRQENKVQSIATVPDGYTVVVGGLEIETEGDVRSQVPLLGSLPLIGVLFRNDSRTRNKSRFFVFIRCSVLRSGTFEDLRYVSTQDAALAGLDEEWPVLEPRIIR